MNATADAGNSSDLNKTELYADQVLDQYDHKLIFRIYLELYTLFSLLCVVANVLISIVIIKFRRIRHEKSNIILLNWTILNSMLMIASPLIFRLAVEIPWISYWSSTAYCLLEHGEFTILLANILIMVLLTVYWYLKLYHPSKFEKFLKNLLFYIGFVYIVCVFCMGLHLDACVNVRFNGISEIILIFAYLTFMVFMVVINILHFFKKRSLQNITGKSNIPFLLSNAYFASFLSIVVCIIFGAFNTPPSVFFIVFCTCMLLSILSPLYFFVILYKCDKDYQRFFRHILTCRCREYTGDEFVDQPVVYNNHSQEEENRC